MNPEKKKRKIWVCKYCQKQFPTAKALKRHNKENLWEGHIKRTRKGVYRCGICDGLFKDKTAFKAHWDDDHDDQAVRENFLSFLTKKDENYTWSIRPTELELVKQRIKRDRNKQALRSDFIVNDMVQKEFDYGLLEAAMTVVEILGIPGVGKSVLGLTIARHLQLLWTKRIKEYWSKGREYFKKMTKQDEFYLPKIRIGFNMDQTTRHINEAKMGDVVIQDEDPSLAGVSAKSVQDQIENFLKIMREDCINLIFISPLPVSYVNTATFVLEALAKDTVNRRTIAAYYDRQYNACGWTVFEILAENDPLMVFYLKQKRTNIKRIKDMFGKEGVTFNREDLMRDANKLYNFIKESGIVDIDRVSVTKEFLKTMIIFVEDIKGNVKYTDAVALTLKQMLDTKKTFSDVHKDIVVKQTATSYVTSDDEFLIELENVIEEPMFLEMMHENLELALKHKERCKDKHKKLHIEYVKNEKGEIVPISKHAEAWYLYYAKGYQMQQVAEALSYYKADDELTASAIANSYQQGGWRAIYQEELSGYAAEVTFKEMFCKEESWELVAGHGEIDLVNHDDDTWIELKLRSILKPKERPEEQITPFEYQHVREGKPFKLVRIGYTPEKCRIEFWNVTINPEWLEDAVNAQIEASEEIDEIDEEEME